MIFLVRNNAPINSSSHLLDTWGTLAGDTLYLIRSLVSLFALPYRTITTRLRGRGSALIGLRQRGHAPRRKELPLLYAHVCNRTPLLSVSLHSLISS